MNRFGVLRHRRFAAFWAAGLASNTGTWLHVVTSSILVFQYTRSPEALGFLGFAAYLPLLLFTLPAGVLTDRVDRRKIVVVTHIAGIGVSAALAVAIHLGVRSVELIAISGFAVYTVYAVSKPAISALFPALVERDEVARATAVNSLSYVLGQLAGPILASICIALDAPALAFALNGASYLAVIVVVRRLEAPRPDTGTPRSVIAQVRGGLSYVARDRTVRSMLIVVGVIAPLPEVMRLFAPATAEAMGAGDEVAGFLAAAIGLGSAIGLSVAARWDTATRLTRTVLAGSAVCAFGTVGLAAAPSPVLGILLGLFLGAGYGVVFGTASGVIQAAVADRLRGQVMSVHTLVHLGTRPLFTPIAGWLASVAGIFGVAGAFVLLLPAGILAAVHADQASERRAGIATQGADGEPAVAAKEAGS